MIDTNVPVTANGANDAASATCVAASARALQDVMTSGHLFIDDGGLILEEYRRNLRAAGEPGPGDAFLRWLLQHEWGGTRVTRVPITPANDDSGASFKELPLPPKGTVYDPADRKFLAVAAAHSDRPPILQSLDSKWWGWRDALSKAGVAVYFLCESEVATKHRKKTSS